MTGKQFLREKNLLNFSLGEPPQAAGPNLGLPEPQLGTSLGFLGFLASPLSVYRPLSLPLSTKERESKTTRTLNDQ